MAITQTGTTQGNSTNPTQQEVDAVEVRTTRLEVVSKSTLGMVNTLSANIANVVNVKDFGAIPNTGTDQAPYIQSAIDHLISLGGGTLLIPSGEYRIVADANTTTNPYNPKRLLISGTVTGTVGPPDTRVVNYIENIHIKGDKNTIIYMTGMSFEYLWNQDDISLGNVDLFCAFTFRYAKKCSISDLTIKGDYVYGYAHAVNGETEFRYDGVTSQARAKAISIIGCDDIDVHDVKVFNILGNFVHVNTASSTLDGYWRPSEGSRIYDNYFNTCYEIGVNLTTTVARAMVIENIILYTNGGGIEGPATITSNTIRYGNGGGISPSADALVTDNNIQDVVSAFVLTISADLSHGQHINTVISNNFVKNIKKHFLHVYPNSGNLTFINNRLINPNLADDPNNAYNIMIYLAGNTTEQVKNVSIAYNYFEINNASSFSEYGFFAADCIDTKIVFNEFNVNKTLVADIYMSNFSNCVVKDNKLSIGIQPSSTNKNRNIVIDNSYPSANFPIISNWNSATLPDTGDWKVGDYLKKNTPIVSDFTSGISRIELGWYCTSVSPLTWKLDYVMTGTTTTTLLSNKGTKFANGDASTTLFTIAHELGATPTTFYVQKAAINLPDVDYATADATNITVNFKSAPPSGTSNIVLKWKVEI